MPRHDPPTRRYVANLPGVGGGFLDTLQMLAGPFTIDTVRTDPSVYAEFQPDRQRMIVNPAWVERVLGMNPNARMQGIPVRDIFPVVLGHEALGHGVERRSSSPSDEREADQIGRALVQRTRDPNLEASGSAIGRLLRMLEAFGASGS